MPTILSQELDLGHIIIPTTKGLTYSDDPLPIALPQQHTAHDEPMATMIAELHEVADTTLVPTYTDPIELSHALQSLHIRDMLGYDDDGVEGVNDIDHDITRMSQNSQNTITIVTARPS